MVCRASDGTALAASVVDAGVVVLPEDGAAPVVVDPGAIVVAEPEVLEVPAPVVGAAAAEVEWPAPVAGAEVAGPEVGAAVDEVGAVVVDVPEAGVAEVVEAPVVGIVVVLPEPVFGCPVVVMDAPEAGVVLEESAPAAEIGALGDEGPADDEVFGPVVAPLLEVWPLVLGTCSKGRTYLFSNSVIGQRGKKSAYSNVI